MKAPIDCESCAAPTPQGFERNQYYFGKELTVRDFVAEQRYFNEKRWLVNRLVLGWGVVCGLGVEVGPCKRIRVAPGFALDCHGREVVVPCRDESLDGEELVHAVEAGNAPSDTVWWICLRYDECSSEPVRLPALCGESRDSCGRPVEETAFNRTRDAYRLELRRRDELDCPQHGCGADPLCERHGDLHERICEVISAGCPPPCTCDCIPLGAVRVCPVTDELLLDACGPRRLVYSNSILQRLVACRTDDLPRIVSASWTDVPGVAPEMPFDAFRGAVEAGLRVEFDHPMDAASLNEHSFLLDVISEGSAGHWLAYRVPAHVHPQEDGMAATLHPDCGWIDRELRLTSKSLFDCPTDVEIRVRGALVRDRSGRALDGEPIAFPTGNGRAAGDFLSAFRVSPKTHSTQRKAL